MSDVTMFFPQPDGAEQGDAHASAMLSSDLDEGSFAASQYAVLCELTRGNTEALLKSTEILTRGLNMLNTAVVGSTCLTIDDAVSETRVAMRCRNCSELMAFEAANVRICASRCLMRGFTLYRMAAQLIEDAAFPLERRFALAIDALCPKAL
ncbi:phasin family protein [Defluviicoccus vanus]|nr:phasin family protein [Defluviicoccus vanus]